MEDSNKTGGTASAENQISRDGQNPSAPRVAQISRKTRETQIAVQLRIDGDGRGRITTGVPFLDHMLDSFARHGFFDLTIEANGDLDIDDHHTVEDVGIVLGRAFRQA